MSGKKDDKYHEDPEELEAVLDQLEEDALAGRLPKVPKTTTFFDSVVYPNPSTQEEWEDATADTPEDDEDDPDEDEEEEDDVEDDGDTDGEVARGQSAEEDGGDDEGYIPWTPEEMDELTTITGDDVESARESAGERMRTLLDAEEAE